MANPFFERPILNLPYECPRRHWELDEQGQPAQRVADSRRPAEFVTHIPKPKKRKQTSRQQTVVFDEGKGLSTQEQQYDPTSIMNLTFRGRGRPILGRTQLARQVKRKSPNHQVKVN